MEVGVVLGVIVIGFVHGVLPDHGWPIAATYALNKRRRLFYGFLAAVILGVGHLISSVVLVLAYFGFNTFAAFAEGPWLRYVAGTILILLGLHEYRYGGHGHGIDEHHEHGSHHHGDDHADHDERAHGHDHDRVDHGHTHGHDHGAHSERAHDHGHDGLLARLRRHLPGGGGHQHLREEHAERGLVALGTTALLLGFAHEEPIQILAICVGTDFCLELMLIYSLAVVVAIVVPTLLLIAGYERYRGRVERLTPYLPTITAVALVGMGLAFILGLV
ncbi:hypothetical protein [Halopiger goleimassiliensis]|uniref:hypothetical protein n=1 Tax=Halopiger goleimassiliensis TaxID=1293048 RepID=UPI000677A3EB|nr:hypothetical protein [Halopiger goleimassiliensis]